MTQGPAVGDATSGQPVGLQAQPVARGGYQGPAQGTDQPFTVDVGGEQVTLDELRGGYMRQRDYTQKTQLLAQQRQEYEAATRLAEALRSDPRGTLLQLAEATGVDMGSLQDPGGQSFAGGAQPGYGGEDLAQGLDPNDPVHQELIALREQVQQLSASQEQAEDHQANAWLDRETATAQQMFEGLGMDVEPEELYQYAAEREITDVQTAAKALAFDRLTEQVQQASQQPSPMPPEYAQFAPEGGQAPSVPMPGNGQGAFGPQLRAQAAAQTPRGGLTSASPIRPSPPPDSVEGAFAQTLQELGITSLDQVDMNG